MTSNDLPPHSVEPLVDTASIDDAVQQLGRRINADSQEEPLVILAVLAGSLVFVADLIREIRRPVELGLVQASSYRGLAMQPGELTVDLSRLPPLGNRDVLVVDDIFDTGHTMAGLLEQLRRHNPRRLRSAVLLWKTPRRQVDETPDFHCFAIPDEFVVGYGLDWNNQYRHLPYVGRIVLRGEEPPT